MHSCVYVGQVKHRRYAPREHAFAYSLFMMYLDLDELDEVFRGRWLWSTRRRALAAFHREDYLGDPSMPLAEAVRDRVAQATGRRPRGPICLLTHLRYFGYCFNPVSFYFCFAPDGIQMEAVVAEVNNTPWGERHAYVLPIAPDTKHGVYSFNIDKAMHVSPFMDMNMSYVLRLTRPGQRLTVHMENHVAQEARKLFDATLSLESRPLNGPSLARALVSFPFMTGKVVAAIYWQALRLWLKKIPFYSHPDTQTPKEIDR